MKKSYLNALYAVFYIALVVSFMQLKLVSGPEILIGITMLTIFVLSAAVMGYLFVGRPLMLYLDGAKKEAVQFFLETVSAFAVVMLILIIIQLIIRFF